MTFISQASEHDQWVLDQTVRSYDPAEQEVIAESFASMLAEVTADGGRKRMAKTKVPWTMDPGHEAGLFSHLARWKKGEKVDPDSGVHPMVHAAWRCLAIAYQEAQWKASVPPGKRANR